MDSNNALSFEDALTEFIAQTKRPQLAILAKMVGMAEAEEILQEAYLKLYLLASKNPDKAQPFEQLMSLKPLFHSMVKNQAISNIRHQKVVTTHLRDTASLNVINEQIQFHSSEFELIKKDRDALILSAINQLPPICRQVFVQRKIHAKSHAEIAEMLGISLKTVESHLAKGLVLCRAYVQRSKQDNKSKLRANSI